MADQISSRPARTADGVRRAHSLRSTTWAMDSPLARQAPNRSAPVRNGCGRPAGATASSPFHPGHRPRSRRRSSNRCPPPAVRPARRRPGTACHWNARRPGPRPAGGGNRTDAPFLEIDDVGPGERQAQPLADPRQARLDLVRSMRSGRQPSRPSITALSVPCPCRSRPASRTADPHAAHGGQRARPHQARGETAGGDHRTHRVRAGGPMPILNRSKALTFIWRFLRPRVRTALDASTSKGASGR